VSPAADIDPTYSAQLRQALAEGLEVYTLFNDITIRGIYPRSVRKWEML
jgi:DNA-binding sugar fermentation-stimulating protein